MNCINCNSQEVTRKGDAFSCGRCHYGWDVAHEQANAAFLRSQGREPAEPLAEETLPGRATRALKEPAPLTDEDHARIWAILETKTVAELEAIAATAGLNLTEARLKADKIAALIESGRVSLSEDRQIVIIANED